MLGGTNSSRGISSMIRGMRRSVTSLGRTWLSTMFLRCSAKSAIHHPRHQLAAPGLLLATGLRAWTIAKAGGLGQRGVLITRCGAPTQNQRSLLSRCIVLHPCGTWLAYRKSRESSEGSRQGPEQAGGRHIQDWDPEGPRGGVVTQRTANP